MTAEQLKAKNKNGFPMRYWFLPAGKRNEALDCRVYATAALLALSTNPTKHLERLREELLKWGEELRKNGDPNQMSLLPAENEIAEEKVTSPVPEGEAIEEGTADELETVPTESAPLEGVEQVQNEVSRPQEPEQNSAPGIRFRKSRWL
jgi:phage terminase large subunit GpA-like protein